MKIAIIGRGTSSIITALTCIKFGYDIEFFYDDKTPFLRIGESTTPHLSELIKYVFNIDIGDFYNEDISSYKMGVKFIDWGKCDSFNMHFDQNKVAFHMENECFNERIHSLFKSKGVKYNNYKVLKYEIVKNNIFINDKKYDFVFFCTGWQKKENEYLDFPFETVNSAILFNKNDIDSDSLYTIHRATENGWQFELPFPKRNLAKCGYLYNNKITKLENIKLEYEHLNTVSWVPQYSKKVLENKFIAKNGNSLFFMEPLHALSSLYQSHFAEVVCKFLENRDNYEIEQINDLYLEKIRGMMISIAFHYMFGSSYDTDFWRNTSEKCKDYYNNCMPNIVEFSKIWYNDLLTNSKNSSVGCFQYNDVYKIYKNLGGLDLKEFK